jgi:hypothetical protein
MFTRTTSARCHSITHSKVRIENCLENLRKELGVADLGAQECPVLPLAAGLSHPVLEGKPNANHVRARIRNSRT